MPLTLAIIDGFLVGVGPSKFIFPLETVIEVIESRGMDVRSGGNGRGVVELRGHILPVVNLRSLYALDSQEPVRSSIVVIQSGTTRYGVMVDVLLGQNQTVIKPLGRLLRGLKGISGSTILGNGEVAMIIDVSALGDLAGAPVMSRIPSSASHPESPLNKLAITH
jgi:two-component system chemotaxis sensor kinase CheA